MFEQESVGPAMRQRDDADRRPAQLGRGEGLEAVICSVKELGRRVSTACPNRGLLSYELLEAAASG